MKTVNILWRKTHIQDTSAYYFRISGFPGGSDRNNQPAMQETGVRSLGGKDPLEKGMDPTPVFLTGKFHGQRSLVGYV